MIKKKEEDVRREVAFLEECRKIKDLGSLKEDFIPNLSRQIKDSGL